MARIHPFGGYNINEGAKYCSIVHIALLILQGIIDVTAIVKIRDGPEYHKEDVLNFDAICGIITLIIHVIICLVGLVGGYTLYHAISDRNYVRCHQWYIKFATILALETLDVFLFIVLAPGIGYVIFFAVTTLLFKFYLLWPMNVFIDDIRGYAEPFASESELHL